MDDLWHCVSGGHFFEEGGSGTKFCPTHRSLAEHVDEDSYYYREGAQIYRIKQKYSALLSDLRLSRVDITDRRCHGGFCHGGHCTCGLVEQVRAAAARIAALLEGA